jgi:hypothetical protein
VLPAFRRRKQPYGQPRTVLVNWHRSIADKMSVSPLLRAHFVQAGSLAQNRLRLRIDPTGGFS